MAQRHNNEYQNFENEGKVAHTATDTIKERPAAPVKRDMFWVSDDQREEYGIKPHEDLFWARDARQWRKIERKDRIQEIKREADGRLVMDADGIEPIMHGEDLVLMAIPKERIKERDDALIEANKAFEQDLTPDPAIEGAVTSHRELFDRSDTEALRRKARMEHEMNVKSGLVGGNSPTAGLSLMEAQRLMERRGVDIEARQAELRRGGQHTQMDQEAFQQIMLRGVDATTRKSFGVGNVQFGRNYQEQLRQRDASRKGQAQGGK